jgi:hypothetical protein
MMWMEGTGWPGRIQEGIVKVFLDVVDHLVGLVVTFEFFHVRDDTPDQLGVRIAQGYPNVAFEQLYHIGQVRGHGP